MELMKSYSEQRRERLSEAVFDYLSDEDTTPDELLTDFIKEVKDTFDYYDKYATKCKKVLDTLRSTNIQETNDPKDWEDFWNSFKSGETLKNDEFDELTCYDTHTNKSRGLYDTSFRG
jgi:hypothetical protein